MLTAARHYTGSGSTAVEATTQAVAQQQWRPLHRQWLNSSGGHYTGSGSTAVEAASAAATADAEYRAVASLSLFEERQGA
jgi:hypothetical protein